MTLLWTVVCWCVRYIYEGFIAGNETKTAQRVRLSRVPIDFCYIAFVSWGSNFFRSSSRSRFYESFLLRGWGPDEIFRAVFVVIIVIFLLWGLMHRYLYPMSQKYLSPMRALTRWQLLKRVSFFAFYHGLLGGSVLAVSIFAL